MAEISERKKNKDECKYQYVNTYIHNTGLYEKIVNNNNKFN